jgi:hypothetical protein
MVFGVFRASGNDPQGKTSVGILNVQLKCFLYGGILPSAAISSSPWKLRIYNVYTTLTLLMYIPTLSAQFYALFMQSDSLTAGTDTLFTIVAALLHLSISCHLLTQRKALQHLVLRTEDSFTEYTSKLPLGTKHTLIISDAKKKIRLYSSTFIISVVITGFLWTSLPYIFWHVHNANKQNNVENKDDESGNKVHWEHFCYRMWLPPSATVHPLYHFVWLYQVIIEVVLLFDYTGYNLLYYALTLHTAAHFKVLATLLEDLDQYITSSDNTKTSEQSANEEGTSFIKEMILKHSGQNERENNKKKTSQLEEYHSSDPGLVTTIPSAEDYLVRCVKYHQAILQ